MKDWSPEIVMRLLFALLLFVAVATGLQAQQTKPAQEKFVAPPRPVHTFSIVAREPATGALGVAVQSHWFSVGSIVPAAEAGVGAVATQAFAEPSYGPLGVARMREGASAREALDELVAAAAHTGGACVAGAGHVLGDGCSAQGNMLESDAVWQALLPAFEAAQ